MLKATANASSGGWRTGVLLALPLFVLYPAALAMMSDSGSIAPVVRQSVVAMAVFAVLGGGARWMGSKFRWPDPPRASFFLLHIAAGIVLGLAWWVASYAILMLLAGHSVTDGIGGAIASRFLGWNVLFGLTVYGVVVAAAHARQVRESLREQRMETVRAETRLIQARLTALQAQLNPHFLFNTLHSLSELVTENEGVAAEEAIDRLGDLLRYTLDRSKVPEVSFREEWRFVEGFLELEKLRFGQRLVVQTGVDRLALDRLVPPFCLQPLVENALRHGLGPSPQGGTLEVHVKVSTDAVTISVIDDGQGADMVVVTNGSGTGLSTLRQRLEAVGDGGGRLDVDTAPGEGFRAVVRIPTTTGGKRRETTG